MFDFRYTLVTLVAVFLALGIGVLFGIGIADSGVVEGARQDLESSLRDDLDQARTSADELRRDLSRRDDFEREVYPSLVATLLEGKRVGIVAVGSLPAAITRHVRESLVPSGGRLTSLSTIAVPLNLSALAQTDEGRTPRSDLQDPDLAEQYGSAIGRRLALGNPIDDRTSDIVIAGRSGSNKRLDGIVFYRGARERALEGADKVNTDAFERGLVEGVSSGAKPVVGVEEADTDPSQTGFFRSLGVTTVDDVDLVAGRVALVYALRGATGSFGTRPDAEHLLPANPATGLIVR